MANPVVFLDIAVDGQALGRITFELFADQVPKTAENFRALCTGERGFGYRGSFMHRIIPGFLIQGGAFTTRNGTGGKSIYGESFPDENFQLKHHKAGILSMANTGPDTNHSQFFITLAPAKWLNGKHVVFGEVKSGLELLAPIAEAGTRTGRTTKKVFIQNCGELPVAT